MAADHQQEEASHVSLSYQLRTSKDGIQNAIITLKLRGSCFCTDASAYFVVSRSMVYTYSPHSTVRPYRMGGKSNPKIVELASILVQIEGVTHGSFTKNTVKVTLRIPKNILPKLAAMEAMIDIKRAIVAYYARREITVTASYP